MTKGNCDNLDVANECLGHAQAEIDALKQDNARLLQAVKFWEQQYKEALRDLK